VNTGEKVLAYLAGYQLKPEGPGKWRSNSPLRPGSNSHSFTLKIESDGERGVWDDHAGGEGGSLYNLCDRLNIDYERKPAGGRKPVDNSKRAYHNLAEYAQLKGVPEQAFLNAKWSKEPVTYGKRPALQFPTAGGTRYRFIDGQSPAFISQSGYKACWYGLKPAAAFAREHELPLILCNGEPSVVVGLHWRIPACAITGGESPTFPDALLAELKAIWTGSILIAMDCDEAGRKAAAGKAKILRAAGYTVAVIDLGLDDKGDLADFCKLYTDSALDTLLALGQDASNSNDKGANSSAAPDLAQLLKELTAARRKNDLSNTAGTAKLLDEIQNEVDKSRLANMGQAIVPFSTLVNVRHKRLDAARANPSPIQGLRSGISKLDELIGGFVPGRVHTFLGDTGMGKSTLVATIAASFAAQAPGLIIPTESMAGDYLDKLVAFKANVPYDLIETGTLAEDQYRAVMAMYNWLEERQVDMLDTLNPSSTSIGSAIRQGIKTRGYQWILIDSLNNLDSLVHDDIYGRTSEAADFQQELVRMGLVVLSTSQVGRNMKDRKNKIPKMGDGLGSGRIEQNADVLMAGYNHQYYVDQGDAELNPKFPPGLMFMRCLKHRWRGTAGGRSTFLTFKGGIGVYD
jgi:replicative DNA helicase